MKKYILIILFIILVLSIIFLTINYLTQKEKINSLQEQNLAQQKEISDLTSQLSGNKEEIQKNIELLNKYQSEIETSMAWFNANSVLGKSGIEETAKYDLTDKCYTFSAKTCEIKLGCFYLVNSEFLNLEYKLDNVTSKKEDKLQSISEFVAHGGGDCEDYSLFYKAEYNHLLKDCKARGGEKIILESYESSMNYADNNLFVFLDNQKDWFVNYATEKNLPSGYEYPNVICGNIYDLNSQAVNGHCLIAFTKNKIEDINDISELNLATIVEPQNGAYMGLINDSSSNITLASKSTINSTSFISEIITDQDLFLFDSASSEWLSYSSFSQKLDSEKAKLISL